MVSPGIHQGSARHYNSPGRRAGAGVLALITRRCFVSIAMVEWTATIIFI